MQSFSELGLPESLSHTLQHMQFTTPTPIQSQAIPHALEGKDILGSAQTGTGKTGAFGIPLVAHLLNDPSNAALILAPTRELARQVLLQVQAMLGKKSKIRSTLLIGGDPMFKQLQQLRAKPRLIVGTPGRINDHLERKSLDLSRTNFLVLDETDRMLDMGFTVQIKKIIQRMPIKRQTMLFSATLPANIEAIAADYMHEPLRVAVNTTSSPAENIEHEVVKLRDHEKHDRLLQELNEREGSVIIFVKTKYGTEKMAAKLSKAGHTADAIHGDLRQNKRDRVIKNFRKQDYRILVATDVAARGLDIPHIEHVINFDLPQSPEDYIHRIGRTARAGAKGSAMCMVTPSDFSKWNAIHRLMDPDAPREPAERRPRSNGGSRKSGANNNQKKRRFNTNKQHNNGGKPSGKPNRHKRKKKSAA